MTELPISSVSEGGCQCGDAHGMPELDAREIPHAIRHGAILGALSQLRAGASMVLLAPHDPKPLLAQIADQFGDAMTHEYVESGPEAWRITFTRA